MMRREMKILIVMSLYCGLFSLGLMPSAFAQATGKFGVIDMKRIFKESTPFVQVENELKSHETEASQKLRQMSESLTSELKDFNVQRELLPESTIKARQQELLMKRKTFEAEYKEETEELAKLQEQRLEPLLNQLKSVVEEIAKKDGYTFIFKDIVFVYFDKTHDITDQVIKRLNQGSPAAAQKPAASSRPAQKK